MQQGLGASAAADRAFAASPSRADAFKAKTATAGPDECWVWTGGKDADGYGRFYIGRKPYRAHRIAVILAGYSLPSGAVVDHVCRNRACVNPAHLRTVDRQTNVHENSEALAHLNSLKTHCPRGHAYEGRNLMLRRGRRYCRACEVQRVRDLRSKLNG